MKEVFIIKIWYNGGYDPEYYMGDSQHANLISVTRHITTGMFSLAYKFISYDQALDKAKELPASMFFQIEKLYIKTT